MRCLDGIGREGIAPGLVECVRASVTYFKPGGTPLNGSQPVTCVDERFTGLLSGGMYDFARFRYVSIHASFWHNAHCSFAEMKMGILRSVFALYSSYGG